MDQKRERLTIGLFIFLFLCAVIDLASGHTGAAICSFGAVVFYLMVSFSAEKQQPTQGDISPLMQKSDRSTVMERIKCGDQKNRI